MISKYQTGNGGVSCIVSSCSTSQPYSQQPYSKDRDRVDGRAVVRVCRTSDSDGTRCWYEAIIVYQVLCLPVLGFKQQLTSMLPRAHRGANTCTVAAAGRIHIPLPITVQYCCTENKKTNARLVLHLVPQSYNVIFSVADPTLGE